MRVLVACEFSGVVRRALQARGFETWSCDLLPAEDGETFWHIQDSVQHVFAQRGWWDLVIAHPPCTRLCNSGVRWLHERNLWEDLEEAADLFRCCLNAPADAVAVENPVMHKHALALIGERPAFSVQPWQFGDPAKKRTCFWTRGLPPLRPTSDMTAADPSRTVIMQVPALTDGKSVRARTQDWPKRWLTSGATTSPKRQQHDHSRASPPLRADAARSYERLAKLPRGLSASGPFCPTMSRMADFIARLGEKDDRHTHTDGSEHGLRTSH
jgi:hypothetical protein